MSTTTTTLTLRPAAQRVREWARSEGIRVADRGRLPNALVKQYLDAHRS